MKYSIRYLRIARYLHVLLLKRREVRLVNILQRKKNILMIMKNQDPTLTHIILSSISLSFSLSKYIYIYINQHHALGLLLRWLCL